MYKTTLIFQFSGSGTNYSSSSSSYGMQSPAGVSSFLTRHNLSSTPVSKPPTGRTQKPENKIVLCVLDLKSYFIIIYFLQSVEKVRVKHVLM